jgi:threonine dehydrogenase-like Zn-dependent dehydrogenase
VRALRVVTTGIEALEVRETDVPEPGPGEMLLEASCTLISPGTELATLRGQAGSGRATAERPGSLGYSFAGTVRAVGPGVTAWRVGQRLAGQAPHASRSVVRADRPFVPLPDGVSPEHGAFASLLAIALNAVRLAHVQIGEAAVVTGQGLVGQLAAQFLRIGGARPVLALDALDARLAIARETGTALTLNVRRSGDGSDAAVSAAVREVTGDEGPRVVIEATGLPRPVVTALRLAGQGARVVLLGSTRGLVPEWDAYADVHRKALTIVGAHSPSSHPPLATFWNPFTTDRNMAVALDLVRDGSLRLGPLITDRIPGRAAPDGFAGLAGAPEAHLGVLLDWR